MESEGKRRKETGKEKCDILSFDWSEMGEKKKWIEFSTPFFFSFQIR